MNREWMKLDNAAKIYPLVESDYITSVFRFSATLDNPIDKSLLLTALKKIIKRFPYYKVTLKTGIFWFYLEENQEELEVFVDDRLPCRRIIKEDNNGYLFRVLYLNNKISVEFNHILADGTAGLTFLMTLIYEYLSLQGFSMERNEWIKDINEEVDDKEYEDSHSIIGKKHLKTHGKKVEAVKNVFHMKDKLIPRNDYNIIYAIIDSNSLTNVAKNYNCSITVLLTSIYLKCMLEIEKEEIHKASKRRPVAIQVPINMRKRIESKSMRNFSLFIIPYLKPDKEYSFESIIEEVNNFVKEKTDINNLLRLMVQNYKTERTLFVRLLPLTLKTIVAPLIYKAVGVDTYSGTISNIGKISLPPCMEEHISRLDFTLGPCPLTKTSCSALGYKDKVYMSFGRTINEPKLEKKFIRKLVKLGIKVQIETHGGENE